jgi:diguanylate cyclase (GGDEF)-like protein
MNEPLNRILAIDDDELMRLMLCDILAQQGFVVTCVESGAQALDYLNRHKPDLILLDVLMPGMNGFECLSIIRNIPSLALLPVVMLTSADEVEPINKAFRLGATDFIAKPINWTTLPHRLRYLMRASQALAQLAKSENDLRTAQKMAHLGSWEWRVADDELLCSEEAYTILGRGNDEALNCINDFYAAMLECNRANLQQTIEQCLQNACCFQIQLHDQLHDRDLMVKGEPLQGADAQVELIQGTIQDITEQQRMRQQLDFLAHYDPLTGLPNRALFKDALNQSMAICDRHHHILAVLFISIDRFKRINEVWGPNVGDQLLKAFSERLTHSVRHCDYLSTAHENIDSAFSISRFGGNEFTVLLSFIKDTHDAVKVAKRIFDMTHAPFLIDNQEIYLWISLGIVVYPGDADNIDMLVKNGEFAMSQAQERGQNTYQFYSKNLNAAAVYELGMENQLRGAIERDELVLYYQPKINMRERRVVGCEALIRWFHPEAGLIPPGNFIGIAEHSGQIIAISDWILKTACNQMQEWRNNGLDDFNMAINISARHFREPNFVYQIGTLLAQSHLPARSIKLELTESVLLNTSEEVIATLKSLRALGVDISIDDFGTGYSSLAYLKKLPISELKIDRSFINDIPHDEDDCAITQAILALARSLALEVVAEGVESPEQAQFLIDHDCEIAQGFLYSKPLPADEFYRFVQEFA